jgi:hypothetical protein
MAEHLRSHISPDEEQGPGGPGDPGNLENIQAAARNIAARADAAIDRLLTGDAEQFNKAVRQDGGQ